MLWRRCDLSPLIKQNSSPPRFPPHPQLSGCLVLPVSPESPWNSPQKTTCANRSKHSVPSVLGNLTPTCTWNTICPREGWERAFYMSTGTHASAPQSVNSWRQYGGLIHIQFKVWFQGTKTTFFLLSLYRLMNIWTIVERRSINKDVVNTENSIWT